MSNDIYKTEVKKLRNEVQLLRDELAIMKRKYEDIIYNLDTDNFSSRFVQEQGDMRTAIEVTAEGIKTKVSKEDLDKSVESTLTQTASQIEVAVNGVHTETDKKLENYATTEWTESAITSEVSALYDKDDTLSNEISTIEQTANRISTRVGNLENGKYKDFTLFEQTLDGFQFTGEVKIVGVDSNLRLGDLTSNWDEKNIRFNNQATISTYNFSGLGQDGLYISANGFGIDCTPNDIYFVAPNGSSFTDDRITLEDYVTTYGNGGGSGSGNVVAVFG